MNNLFKNKYRIRSTRLQNWDYSSNGNYFITICTKNRHHYFGKIIDGKMQLSDIGIIAERYWNEIPNHFSCVILDEFIIMPNHIHGILVIEKNNAIGNEIIAMRRDKALPCLSNWVRASPPLRPKSRIFQNNSFIR